MKALSIACVLLFTSLGAWSDTAVIVHPSNDNNLSKQDISRIYLGKSDSFPNGSPSKPINQSDKSLIRASFSKNILKKTQSQLKRYWAKRMFSAESPPPREVSNDEEVKKLVSQNPNYIGYIDALNVDKSVKVVITY